MVGWHHQLDEHVFEQAPGVGDGQGSLACWSPWALKELDMTGQLNNSHTVKGFDIVNETEVDVFLEFPSYLYDLVNVGNLISGSSSFSQSSLDIWKFLVHIMLKPSMQVFKHDLTSMGDECNCLMVSTFFSTPLLGNWDAD